MGRPSSFLYSTPFHNTCGTTTDTAMNTDNSQNPTPPTGAHGTVPHTTPNIELAERPVGGAFLLKDAELPFRFKQSTFAVYEPFLARAIATGEMVEVNPAPLRATTFAARCRDAVIAKKRFNWPASFSTVDLEEADLVVRHGAQTVLIGPRTMSPVKVAGEVVAFGNINDKRINGIIVEGNITERELQAFSLLLQNKRISGPVIIKAPVDANILNDLEAQYDIAVMPTNAKGETIIL